MDKKTEKKILEELRKRVLEKDKELQNKEERKSTRDSTKEALAELTSLSKAEVDQMARQIQSEVLKKRIVRKRRITTVTVIIVIISVIFMLRELNKEPKIYIVDKFDDPAKGWEIDKNFSYHRYFDDGKYMFEGNQADWCYWDQVEIDLPVAYTVEVQSTWIKGIYDDYSVILNENGNDYSIFQLRADGAASYGQHAGDKWSVSDSWKENVGYAVTDKKPNIQRIKVNNGKYEYSVNENHVKTGNFGGLNIKKIGFRLCDKQLVAYHYIKVYDDSQPRRILFQDDFVNPNANWKPKMKFESWSYFDNGRHILQSNKDKNCFWSNAPYKIKDDLDYDISLFSTWLEGEAANYGFMILDNNDNYHLFELIYDGKTRYRVVTSGEYTTAKNYKETGIRSDGTNTVKQTVKIRGQYLEYYVNEQFIDKYDRGYMFFNEIGVRVCGRQTVAFDSLVIAEQ